MAFLTLQGWTVPVEKGGSHKVVPIGDRAPAFDGTIINTRQRVKRHWNFVTNHMEDKEADGLNGMITGAGDKAPFESVLWTDKGDYPTGTPVATITPSVDQQSSAADVYEESSGAREAKFGDGSLWMGPASENLLSADSADAENAPVGYTLTSGATIAGETTIILQGSKALKVTTAAVVNSGAYTDTATGYTGGNTYTGLAYIYTTEALGLLLNMYDGVGSTSTTWTTTPNVWELVEVTRTIDVAASTLILTVAQSAAIASKVFYCDMFQIEEQSYGTPWIDRRVSATRAAPSLDYGAIDGLTDNLTFAAWVRAPTTERVGANGMLLRLEGADGNVGDYIRMFRGSSANNIILQFGRRDAVSNATLTYATTPWDGDWHHVACVFSAHAGATRVGLYFDGTEVQNATDSVHFPLLRYDQTICQIGQLGGTLPFDGRISEAFILPYAMSDEQIAALAARTTALPQYPKLEAAGDFNMSTDYQPITVAGVPGQTQYAGVHIGGAYAAQARKVSFGLNSVEDI